MFAAILNKAAKEYGISLTEEQAQGFKTYYQLLIEWNERINLTAITAPEEVAVKHMIDSLSCFDEEFFPAAGRIIDVGTGAGFPGIPLKIFRTDLKLTLLDSLNKRLNFLKAVTDSLALEQVELVHARAEEAGQRKDLREKYQVALSRAVARLNILSELCLPLVAVGGHFIALKGAQFEQEITEAQSAIDILGGKIVKVMPVKLPFIEDNRAVIYIKKVKNTPRIYPRRAGSPEKKPL
jgi:16S rRNA (guanine527-N7)-methyltransferase